MPEGIARRLVAHVIAWRVVWAMALACSAALFSCIAGGTPTAAMQPETPVARAMNLNAALEDFSAYIAGRRLPEEALTAIAVMDTPAIQLGNYVADKLTDLLLNNAGLRMVSRQDFEQVLAEQNIQSGSFNDETTARIGHNLGWQTIIYGSLGQLQDAYSLSLRAVDVETGELRGSKSYLLTGTDPVFVSLVSSNESVQRVTEWEQLLVPFNEIQNDFNLSIKTDKTVYYDRESMSITLSSDIDCFFVVYHLDSNNAMQVIYPNALEKGRNNLQAGVSRVIPENTSFILRAPYGEERILVYASDLPIDIPEEQYAPITVTRDAVASTQQSWSSGMRGLSVVSRNATGQVKFIILPR